MMVSRCLLNKRAYHPIKQVQAHAKRPFAEMLNDGTSSVLAAFWTEVGGHCPQSVLHSLRYCLHVALLQAARMVLCTHKVGEGLPDVRGAIGCPKLHCRHTLA